MTNIKNIELIIRDMIRTDEAIVSTYDSKLLCKDYENTLNKLKELYDAKTNLIESLEENMNEFFKLKQNILSKKLKINSFKLVPTLIGFEYQFYIPRTVDRTSRQYYCYISMMDQLTREYDSISKVKDEYLILDITATLNLDKLFKNKIKGK